jgi:hypothetical protein
VNLGARIQDLGDGADDFTRLLSGLGIDLDSATSEEVAETGTELYNALTKKYRPLIDALPDLAKIVGKELTVVFRSFLRMTTEMAANKEFQEDLAAMQLARARNRKSAVDAYMKAGFTRKEAMELLIADAASLRAAMQDASRSASKSSSKDS